MDSFPDSLRAVLRQVCGAEPDHIQFIAGGMVNQTARVDVNGTHYFIKWNSSDLPSLFEAEARGLNLLRSANTFRIPEVIACGECNGATPGYLILEWIASATTVEEVLKGDDKQRYVEAFAQALATLHRTTGTQFGLDHDNYNGKFAQRNTPASSWGAFYRDQRIGVQMEFARQQGYLPPHREKLIRDLMDKVEDILAGATSQPALIHGDIWTGNVLVAANHQSILIDPAAYYADREVEIANTETFGGGSAFFLDAYREIYPLDPGYEYRRPLLQLYPLLSHLNHFGEEYGNGVEELCKHYLG